MGIVPGQLIPLLVEKPAAGGRMIARVGGQVVLVSAAIPGERLTARVERIGKGVVYAQAESIEDASADRREPFADPLCGGCLYAHIAYPRQLEIKAQIIADAFARIGRVVLPGPVPVAGSRDDGYRMRARLHVRGRRVGFFREGTNEICDARATRQLLPATADAVDRVAAALQSREVDQVRQIQVSENIEASERVDPSGRGRAGGSLPARISRSDRRPERSHDRSLLRWPAGVRSRRHDRRRPVRHGHYRRGRHPLSGCGATC